MQNLDNILVSVIIPTYGRTDYLKEAIDSVTNQTYQNIEIIVCDDNAKLPEIREEVKKIVSGYPQCKLILNKENLGGALNRNEGIKAANGELISFLDDDDVYMPARIEKVVKLYKEYQQEKVAVIYTYCQYTNGNLKVLGEYCIEPTDNPLYKHMCGCLCATSQWTIPRYVFDEVGMFEPTPCKQDSIMLLKALGKYNKALCVKEHLSLFRAHDGVRISQNFEKHLVGEQKYSDFLHYYYNQLTSEQIKHVECGIARRLYGNYSGMRKYSKMFSCLKQIIRAEGILSITTRDILYFFASPLFYKRIYSKFIRRM